MNKYPLIISSLNEVEHHLLDSDVGLVVSACSAEETSPLIQLLKQYPEVAHHQSGLYEPALVVETIFSLLPQPVQDSIPLSPTAGDTGENAHSIHLHRTNIIFEQLETNPQFKEDIFNPVHVRLCESTLKAIDDLAKPNKKILFHCMAGRDRSPSLALAYLVYKGLSIPDAFCQIAAIHNPMYARIDGVAPFIKKFSDEDIYDHYEKYVLIKSVMNILVDLYKSGYVDYTAAKSALLKMAKPNIKTHMRLHIPDLETALQNRLPCVSARHKPYQELQPNRTSPSLDKISFPESTPMDTHSIVIPPREMVEYALDRAATYFGRPMPRLFGDQIEYLRELLIEPTNRGRAHKGNKFIPPLASNDHAPS